MDFGVEDKRNRCMAQKTGVYELVFNMGVRIFALACEVSRR